MNLVAIIQAAVLGIVEGLTEFLPISATGHLILARALLGLRHDAVARAFDVAIRSGALLALVVVMRSRVLQAVVALCAAARRRPLGAILSIGVLAAALVGLGPAHLFEADLFTGPVIAAALAAGALAILWVERRGAEARIRVRRLEDLAWTQALAIGALQCLGLVPGVSRTGAAVIGGMALGLSRAVATDFALLLAVPTLLVATACSGWDQRHELGTIVAANEACFAVGFGAAFFAAWVCLRWLRRVVATHAYVAFAWYRLALALVVLASWLTGMIRWAP